MSTEPKKPRPPVELPPAEELVAIVKQAITNFKGSSSELESAIGFLFIGHAFGWKMVHLIHSPATVRKYEKLLDIKAREVFPERTDHSDRSVGFNIAVTLSNFWRAVKGEIGGKEARSREIK